MKVQKFKHYEYPLKDSNGNVYYGSYTIRDGAKPKKYKGEKLVQTFETPVLEEGELNPAKEENLLRLIKTGHITLGDE